jgi:hypothetical protein
MTIFDFCGENEIEGGISGEVGKKVGRSYSRPGEICYLVGDGLDLSNWDSQERLAKSRTVSLRSSCDLMGRGRHQSSIE